MYYKDEKNISRILYYRKKMFEYKSNGNYYNYFNKSVRYKKNEENISSLQGIHNKMVKREQNENGDNIMNNQKNN